LRRSPKAVARAHAAPPPPAPSQERLKALKKEHGAKSLGETTVEMCIGGMRGIPVRCAARKRAAVGCAANRPRAACAQVSAPRAPGVQQRM
jgi:hypothetical protein